MVFCVGLTGGIASGKSTVAELFSDLGVQVIYADKVSRELTAKNQTAYYEIITYFGSELVDETGELNRKKLRSLIFSDAQKRNWLEQLLHPLVRKKINELVNLSSTTYCMVEIPLHIDKKFYPYINRVLLVSTSDEVQIARVMQRDQCTRQEALAILAVQPDMTLRLQNADDVLINNSGLVELKSRVENLHDSYCLLRGATS